MRRAILLLVVLALLGCSGKHVYNPLQGKLSVRIVVFGIYKPEKVEMGIAPSIGEINAKTVKLSVKNVEVKPNETVMVDGWLISKPYRINGREFYYCGNVTIEVYEAKVLEGSWSRVSKGLGKKLCTSRVFLPPNASVPFKLVITGLKRGRDTLAIVAKGEWWRGWTFLNVTVG